MKIEITTMTLRNFKKVREQKIDFQHNTLISGGNKTGKTTIYDAYLWCVFGALSKKNGTVQPLDAENKIRHKLETSVTVVLNVDNEREVRLQRILSERWSAKDTADEKLLGTQTTRFINDVPYSEVAYKKKLGEICDYDRWFMLSNINLFMSYKVEERRRILMSIAGNLDEKSPMKLYPIVYRGVVEERKDINEIFAQYNTTKNKADKELDEIPAKVNAQDALKVEADFERLQERKNELDKEILSLDLALQGSSEKNPLVEDYLTKLQSCNEKEAKAQKEWQKSKIKQIDDLTKKILDASNVLIDTKTRYERDAKNNNESKIKLAEIEIKFKQKIKEWNDVNEKKFCFNQTDVCPICGRPYTDEMKEKEYANAVVEYNAHKAEKLTRIQNEASELKQQMVVLKGNINTFEQITKVDNKTAIQKAQTTYNELVTERTEVQKMEWDCTAEKSLLDHELKEIQATKPIQDADTSVEDIKAKKKSLSLERDEIIKRLAGLDTNKRIEQEKKKLNERSLELAQIIADCNEAIRQIKDYKKAKITAVEEKVNTFFSLVRWKFYEQNTSNDGEKAICAAIDKGGVDYDNTNDGTVINMGVDIIGGISKALNLFVPLFVDRKESAEEIVSVKQQTIYLQCIFGKPLSID